ncbi:sodium:solute symporter [Arenibacter sp. M-2]|uniref:sodium:solute symporter n=1 Tax=unclassified Arenibacter TaxID=2615047 RepID=UPI000D7688CE|nr:MULTISPECIES: sodium:solute symporter [unclassified Arenibacter]MDL5510364.1 sodium:solute symporter [Arenibacter sp. M-2]PXX31230.1 SSS family solute:Na+ symporter [Arenibacter sp. ARW7G5Y1]|tara:strand:- start:9197 stop:10780 length:1584 start_codon:yes stop_codon:yes gene_type:complete
MEIHELLKPLDFMVVGLYLFTLIGIGYWVSFRKKRAVDENLFLAGNSLGWPSIGFTMWGTNVGPSMLIASASIGYTTGIVAGNFAWYAFIFIFLLAVVFAPRYMGSKVQTLPEFMGKRFGDSTQNILAWYTIVTILISWLSLTLFAGGILIQQILDLPMVFSVIVLLIIASFFTIAGGLKAIAYTNVFQMVLLIAVSLALTLVGLNAVGGVGVLIDKTPAGFWNLLLPADDANYPWIAIVLGYPVMGVWFWCTDQSMVQSVLGAKNISEGQLGANFTGWLKILDVVLFILPGIMCLILFPDLTDPDEAYMTMVTNLFPTGMIGLVMAILIAALVSTIDSALNALSTVFTMDIYVKKFRPQATQKKIVSIGRLATISGAVIAIGITMAINSIKGLNLFDVFQSVLGFIAPPMSVVFLFGVLWPKTTTRAANAILLFGTILSLGIGGLYLWVFPNEVYGFWPHFLLLSFYIFVFLSILIVVISLLDKSSSLKSNTLDYGVLPKMKRKVKILWIMLIIVMVAMYIIFNGH